MAETVLNSSSCVDEEDVEDIRSKLCKMKELESTTYKRPPLGLLPEPFNGVWRQQIIEWMYTLVKCCNLQHSSAAAASYFLDVAASAAAVSSPEKEEEGSGGLLGLLIQSPDDYQLVAMTSLYVALKMYDTPSHKRSLIKLQSLVQLGNGDFTEEDILQMELDLLNGFQWNLCPPTPNCFLYQYLSLLPAGTSQHTKSRIEDFALHAIEIAMARDTIACSMKPSTVAYSAILRSFHRMDQGDMPLEQLHSFLGRLEHVEDMDHASCRLAAYNAVVLDLILEECLVPGNHHHYASSPSNDSSSSSWVVGTMATTKDVSSHEQQTTLAADIIAGVSPSSVVL